MKPSNSYALLVGVGQRKDDPSAIAVTAEDATRLAKELNQRCGFPERNIRSLKTEEASRVNILRQLDVLAADTKIQPADLVILFFSGHGLRTDDQSFLISYDTDRADIDNTAVDGDTFIKKINRINAQTVLILLNCCHSGAILSDGYQRTGIPFDKNDFIQKPNRAIITACTNTELAYTSKPLSVFTYALVVGLAGEHLKRSDKKAVTLFDLAMFIREEVVWLSKGKQHPELEILQKAETTNFEVVNYQNGIPAFIREEFKLEDERGVALHLEKRDAQPDNAYREKFDWLGKMKNVIVSSNIETGGSMTIGDRIYGQNNPTDDNYDTKNAIIGSTIKAGGDFRLGDDVFSGNQQVHVVHNYYDAKSTGPNAKTPIPVSDLKTKLKALLAKEKTEEVIDQLLDHTETSDKNTHQTILVMSARFHRINSQEQKGTIGKQEAGVERNSINDSLAGFIDGL